MNTESSLHPDDAPEPIESETHLPQDAGQIMRQLVSFERLLKAEVAALKLPLSGHTTAPQSASTPLPDIDALPLAVLIDYVSHTPIVDTPLFKKLTRLDAAICQLELGLYGLCADCEATIEPSRLTHDPTEQRCSRCEERYLHQHRQELRLKF